MRVKRGVNKNPVHRNIRDAYKLYEESTVIPKHRKVDYQTFKVLLEKINKELIRMVVEESLILKLPMKLGQLRVMKYKPEVIDKDGNFRKERMAPNWKATKEYWQKEYPDLTMEEIFELDNKILVYHDNSHTGGYTMTFKWENSRTAIKGKTAYSFIPTRKHDRSLAEWLKNPYRKNDYYT